MLAELLLDSVVIGVIDELSSFEMGFGTGDHIF
jgi:hypothetical protein